MGRKRFKDQILCRILEVCAGGKTQIIYQRNLNFNTVLPYLELLIRNGLAVRIKGAVLMYNTTPKGLRP